MKISDIFDLKKSQYELDFVDVDIDKDLPLFLDPYYISKSDFPFAIEAHRTLQSFFNMLLTMLKENKIQEAEELFSHLGESNEICLGFSRNKPKGRGMGPKDAEKIFKSLLKSKAIETGVMEDIEDLRIFVPNVDKDKVSDMTANIIKKQLIKYTQDQCNLLGIPLTNEVISGHYWDRKTRTWENDYTQMLIVRDKKYLLVPKRIVSFSKAFTPQKYTQHFVLNFLQNEQLRLNGRLVNFRRNKKKTPFVTKKSVRDDIQKTRKMDKEFLIKFTSDHPDVFRDFQDKAKNEINVLKNKDLTNVNLREICEYLINRIRLITPGAEEATIYHRTIVGILELLFYPRVCSPTIEQEIHDGRKRIDILFDNCAETGFFNRLVNTHGIPSSFIIVECKNYSRDIANPELDQISGRFSPNRGKVGIIVCRTIDDYPLFIKRCKDTYRDQRGLILPLIDEDIIRMLDEFPSKGINSVEEHMQKLFHDIVLS